MRKQGLYTDLTIRCNNGTEHKVHKAVVCSQSKFFHNACKPDSPFKEAQTGVIELTEDDPRAVKAMVTFFYEEEYGDQLDDKESDDEFDDGFIDEIDSDESSMDAAEKKDPYLRLLMFHLNCYVLAEKYEIRLLMACALKKIRIFARMPYYYCCQGFPTAVLFAYENTVASTRGGRQLRDALLHVCASHLPTLVLNPRFDATLGPVADFWRELARAQAKLWQSPSKWLQCPKCTAVFPAVLQHPGERYVPENYFACPFCREFSARHHAWDAQHILSPPEDQDFYKQQVEETMRMADEARRQSRLSSSDSAQNPPKRHRTSGGAS